MSFSCSIEYFIAFSGFSYTRKYFKKKFHSTSWEGTMDLLGTACRMNSSIDSPF